MRLHCYLAFIYLFVSRLIQLRHIKMNFYISLILPPRTLLGKLFKLQQNKIVF